MVYASPESEYIKLLAPFLKKKKNLAADGWGSDSKRVKDVFDPIEKWMIEAVSV